MSSPPIRPIRVIGRAGSVDVEITQRFLRWLEDRTRQADSLEVQKAPTGSIVATFATAQPSSGEWLICNGQSVPKATNAALYEVIGGAFGETATEFSLPDLSGRFLVGAGAIGLMGVGGASEVTLGIPNLPAHSHTVTDPGHTHGVTDPGHTHTAADVDAGGVAGGSGGDGAVAGNTGSATTGVSVGSATTGISLGNTGSGTAFNITPPAVGVNWLIKT